MLSEMLFSFLLLTVILLLCLENPYWAVAAGGVAGLAFLTRTAGIALLPAAVVYYFLFGSRKRKFHQMAFFAAGMMPSALGWAKWSMSNRTSGDDPVTLYYSNYFGHFLANFHWKEAHLYLWKNVDGMLHGLGAFLLPNVSQSLLDKVLAVSLGIAGVLGVIRMVRANRSKAILPYAIFAAFYCFLLAIWHFPPTERFMLPVAPLWLVGLYVELMHVAGNIVKVYRKPERSQKIAGGAIAGLFVILFAVCGVTQWDLLANGLPRYYDDHARRLEESEPAMAWIRENLPAEARIYSENDPLLYLRTGRRGARMFPETIHWYRQDQAAATADLANAAMHARALKLDYLLFNDWDWARDMPAGEHEKLIGELKKDPRLVKLFVAGPTAVFSVR
jgi:4-amino-4-deoxy-L-arabinose transferase-like glycosyltransferase